ncbi:hypothetical protein [Peptoanaerobacter stomatis]
MFKKKKMNIKRDMFVKKKKSNNFVSRKMEELYQNIEFLNKVNYNLNINEIKIILVILSIAGIFLGILLKNMYISIAMLIIFPLYYLEYLNFTKNQVAIRIEKQIIKYSELIKNSYLANHDIRRAIKENMNRFAEPIKSLFEEFIREVEIYNYYPKEAILNMNKKIETPSLKKLTEQLALCEEDRRFDNSLQATTMLLNDRKSFLTMWEYKSKNMIQIFITTIALMNVLILLMLFGYGDIGKTFMKHFLFKPLLAIFLVMQSLLLLKMLKKVNSINI